MTEILQTKLKVMMEWINTPTGRFLRYFFFPIRFYKNLKERQLVLYLWCWMFVHEVALHPPPSAARSCAGHSRSCCCWPRPCCPPSPAAACCWRCRGAPAATPCPAQSATQEVVFTRSTGGAEIRENFTIFWELICKWDTFCPSSKVIINRQLRLCLPTPHWWLTLWTIIPI